MLSFRKPARAFLPMATQGHLPQASQRNLGHTGGISAEPWGRGVQNRVPPRGACPEGSWKAAQMGPGLTGLGEKVLDLGNGGMGFHLGEAQAANKLRQGGV